MDRSWLHGTLFSNEYVSGVKEIMDFIKEKFGEKDEILCPCARCLNQKYLDQANVKNLVLMNSMDCTYTQWIYHGENINLDAIELPVHDNDASSLHGMGVLEDDSNGDDRLEGILRDLQTAEEQGRPDGENQDGNPMDKGSFLDHVMKEAKCQLYPALIWEKLSKGCHGLGVIILQ
jgi:hypothetical protein